MFPQITTLPNGLILQQFFDEIIATRIEPTVQLESASLGKSKNSLDQVDLSLPLDSTVELFGPFLWYYVKDNNIRKSSPRLRNTFEILMSSQKQECLPTIIHQVRTLFRLLWIVCGILMAITIVLVSSLFLFHQYFLVLLDIHVTFQSSQNTGNGNLVICVQTYWRPWRNLYLRIYSAPFGGKHHGNDQLEVESLATNITSYANYLSSKNKVMKVVHTRTSSVREFSDSISIKVIATAFPSWIERSYIDSEGESYKYIFMNDFAPDEPQKIQLPVSSQFWTDRSSLPIGTANLLLRKQYR